MKIYHIILFFDRCPLHSYRSHFGTRPSGYGYGGAYTSGPNAAAAVAIAEMQAPLNPVGVGGGPVYPVSAYPPAAVPLMGATAYPVGLYPAPVIAPVPSLGMVEPVAPLGVGVEFGGMGVGVVAPVAYPSAPAVVGVGVGMPVLAASPAYVDMSDPMI